ncbi:hypothetical protein FC16_GL001659 [Loigolactobacillus coryniformis subsp. torquens DSM 20004 = KCTC 3535]|uniref:Uncharacterized protein n=1 Tax=Loigolactobacillus coryniformis subsp. coryniformis KCTC 3167 = DSM 20001 TaxID=913848 RepID=A0A0R1F447_9LACO|nr:hypothetical protein FD22_GL001201 [Loigolactobacillus coryniformis subsp. coryniformis KCTC 3167 = DSM 20001]KRK84175.1 hypothetical protein FC16_GL001659 [Loigolactobacillus coryniformis subsp. torquens DSM 20004 = KCTC 3535]
MTIPNFISAMNLTTTIKKIITLPFYSKIILLISLPNSDGKADPQGGTTWLVKIMKTMTMITMTTKIPAIIIMQNDRDHGIMKIMTVNHRSKYRNGTPVTIADHRMIIAKNVIRLTSMSNVNHGHPTIEKMNTIHGMNTTNVQSITKSLHIRKLVPNGHVKKLSGNDHQNANQNR